ncbi:MAG TPA: anaerobic ribonucleoside-triphosphate reductase [bacterium]|nr:anaerobic ribonucleoside-triphosphate reductase [bacterium]
MLFFHIPAMHSNTQRTRCEIYTRVMGYYRPVSQFNEGKKSEFYSREYFDEHSSANSRFMKEFG